jgi:hypothetical protein
MNVAKRRIIPHALPEVVGDRTKDEDHLPEVS